MSQDRPTILIISSANPTVGPGRFANDYFKAFKSEGYDVDFLTLYPVESELQIDAVYSDKLLRFLHKAVHKVSRLLFYNRFFFDDFNTHHFFYRYEELPPVPNFVLLSKIKRPYELVLIHFWQDMLSFSSIKALYEKLHCPIHFLGADYSQMSGGCHFVGECTGYQNGCSRCPEVSPKCLNRFTGHNVKYRQKVYQMVDPVVWGNTHMREYYDRSFLLKDAKCTDSDMIMDTASMIPTPKEQGMKMLGLPEDSFVIAFGCQGIEDHRKGIAYLIESLRILYDRLDPEKRKKIVALSVGRSSDELTASIPFEYKSLGYVDSGKLALFYSASDVFVSTPIDDAGPTMVNLSLCYGVPVVSFEMGTALECVLGQGTGYCAKLMDSSGVADGIEAVLNQSDEENKAMRKASFDFADSHYSYKASVKRILDAYYKFL